MKKLIILISAIICLSSCCEKQSQSEQIENNGSKTFKQAFSNAESGVPFKFEYDGHQYIGFPANGIHQGFLGVVHDPDCPCHNIKD